MISSRSYERCAIGTRFGGISEDVTGVIAGTQLKRNHRDVIGMRRAGASLGWVRRARHGDTERIHLSTTRRERREDDVSCSCKWSVGGNCLGCEAISVSEPEIDGLEEIVQVLNAGCAVKR